MSSRIDVDEIRSKTTNGNLTLDPNGTGDVVIQGASGSSVDLSIKGGDDTNSARIFMGGDSNPLNGRIVYSPSSNFMALSTNGDERMRIDSAGKVGIGDTSPGNVLDVYGNDAGNYLVSVHNDGNNTNRYGIAISCGSDTGSGTNYLMGFRDGDHNSVGSITFSGSTTSFNTSSDHRLKENAADMTGAIARVKQLAPKRFNFIRHPDTTVDGFLAHEAQTVVPEAVTGTHNGVDDDGNAVMQGIDQSKLVPLLTAALKESIAKIEALEARVAALEDA